MDLSLSLEPELYVPSINNNGEYVDVCPAYIRHGIRCGCGSRTDHIYDTKSKFKTHINTQAHKNWIMHINNNKKNIYEENVQLNELVKNQREIISNMEKEMINHKNINKYLENKIFISHNCPTVTNLLDIN